ncbi:NADPH:quinone oxidoreductase family protein [Novosphingobium sp. EMRT-2]|uniref:NADPH:quinone oxidoreductase family protein n=1 Tax=Novosphingobium sp. EMRT-2 TaxID=2571749 RepID=UPI0010BE0D8A|nr:NADPH:quinone oxidoreductase family protein [Novosphingobium sp. EMRT-2]QCI95860.1 NADPH:quinone oxidoreductase family protein [Novosphingobium sp. EMRT-2]
MKRVAVHRLDGIDALVLDEAPVPQPASGEVRLRVNAVGLGFVDGLLIAGQYQWKPPLPYVPGGEIAGTIDAVGEGVTGWSAGQRVVAWRMGGGLAEYCTVPTGALVAVPDRVPLETAAAVVLDYATADYALNVRGRLQPGETVFVLGANGGVGGAAMQIARANGAIPVAGVSAGHRRDAAMARGAMATVDLSAPGWRDELRAVLKGKAPDVVVDPLGGPLTEPAFRSLAKRGRHLVIGFAAGGIPALPVNLALLKNADLLGVDIRDFAESEPDRFAERVKTLLDRIARGELASPPVCKHDFAASKDAFRSLQRRDRSGKPVIALQSG